MSIFDGIFNTRPKPVVVPPPVPTPVGLPELDRVQPPVPATQIKLEKKVVLLWKETPVPFLGAKEVSLKVTAAARSFYSMRVTVLSGQLTMRAPALTGPNNPAVKGYVKGQIFHAGDSFIVTFWIGPTTKHRQGLHDRSSMGVDTVELKVIATQSADVVYV